MRMALPEARPCCCCIPSRAGVMIIGSLDLIFASLACIASILHIVFGPPQGHKRETVEMATQPFNYILLVIAVIWLFAAVIMIYGASHMTHSLQYPNLVVRFVVMVFLGFRGAFLVMAVLYLAMDYSLGIFLSALVFFLFLLQTYFLYAACGHYKYTRAVAKQRRYLDENVANMHQEMYGRPIDPWHA